VSGAVVAIALVIQWLTAFAALWFAEVSLTAGKGAEARMAASGAGAHRRAL
jgi:hypothetical protein